MITFCKLGNYGRLGNQIFQYSFLRDRARRLGVKFWCPSWEGDQIFNLRDEGERASDPGVVIYKYHQHGESGYSLDALNIQDNTEIEGYFQSADYYANPNEVKGWFEFKEVISSQVLDRYQDLDFSKVVSVSLRLDSDYRATREFFPLYSLDYYEKALSHYSGYEKILVFADRIDLAKKFLSDFSGADKCVFVDNLLPPGQLFLMTRCGIGNILTNSTFAWWGGYLNGNAGAKIVAPQEWNRPGVPVPTLGIIPDYWISQASLHPFFDNFKVWRMTHPVSTVRRVIGRIF